MEVTMEAITEEEQLQAQETPPTCQLAVIQPMRRRSDLNQASHVRQFAAATFAVDTVSRKIRSGAASARAALEKPLRDVRQETGRQDQEQRRRARVAVTATTVQCA